MKSFFLFGLAVLFFHPFHKKPQIVINSEASSRPVVSVRIPAAGIFADPSAIGYDEGKKILAVFMLINGKPARVSLAGSYTLHEKTLSFTPSLDLTGGSEFEAQYYDRSDTLRRRFTIDTGAPIAPPAEALRIYPATEKIPANILLFYVEFSAEMKPDMLAFNAVKLLDGDGNEKTTVWRQRSYWENNGKILVLMIHPGRVKRGINYMPDLGPVFIPGQKYTLVVTAGIHDRFDRPLAHECRREFTVTEDDREMPRIDFSVMKPPGEMTKEPLHLKFSEGMDYVSIITGIRIRDTVANTYVKGEFKMNGNDSAFNFYPENHWRKTVYQVEFTKYVSDFANNHLHRLFEINSLDELNEDQMPIRRNFIPVARNH
jgi:hypothetical protein